MQILQWFFKQKQEEEQSRENAKSKKSTVVEVKEVESKELISYTTTRRYVQPSSKKAKGEAEKKDLYSLRILLCRGNAIECFYSTLNLKCLGMFDNRHNNLYQVRVKGLELLHMGHKAAESPAHVGNKVLPICEASVTSSTSTDDHCVSSEKKEKPKGGDKSKRLSRMKELLRWAAASQVEKGGKYIAIGRKVLHFRNRSGGKAPSKDDNDSTNSPKISFSWETLSCSTTSSAYTALSLTTPSKNNRKGAARASTDSLGHEDLMTSDNCIEEKKVVKGDEDHCSPRAGNWITTDSEFVVLEL